MPDDKLGVIVVATKDFSNGVTSRIADAALKAMLAERENKSIPQPEITSPIDAGFAKKSPGDIQAGIKRLI